MYHKIDNLRYPVIPCREGHLNGYGVNLKPREQIQICVFTGVIFLLMGIITIIAALISTPDISQPLRMIGPCFVVIGSLIIAICRCCLKKLDAEDGDEDDVAMLSVESEKPVSSPLKELIEPPLPA